MVPDVPMWDLVSWSERVSGSQRFSGLAWLQGEVGGSDDVMVCRDENRTTQAASSQESLSRHTTPSPRPKAITTLMTTVM